MDDFTGIIIEKAREQNVKFIRLQFTSISGFFKNIAVTVEELPAALEGRVVFDGSVIEGVEGAKESDIYLVPDPATFVVFPWRPREGAVARLICDIRNKDGSNFMGCPRGALKRVLAEYQALSLSPTASADIEFYLFHVDDQGRPQVHQTHDLAGYGDLTPLDRGENARRDMVLTLKEMGFDVALSFHERGPGQHEIHLKDEGALAFADNISTFKFVIRTIAQRHGLHASFMPRPLCGEKGSSLKIYLSLYKGDSDVFFETSEKYSLSKTARRFLGGLIQHAGAVTALCNPTVNSYKRLVAGSLAPVLAAWSYQNRNTMIKVVQEKAEAIKMVLRSPDPSCNPYLALASLLVSGIDGIKSGVQLPEPFEEVAPGPGFIRDLARKEGLPRNLEEAMLSLAGDMVIKKAIGEKIYKRYMEIKEDEWQKYQSTVHKWEVDQYLTLY